MDSPFFEPQPKEKIEEWSLVLTALDIPHWIVFENERARLVVPERQKQRALEELQLYEWENTPKEPQDSIPWQGVESTFWTILLLTAVLSFTFEPEIRPILERNGLGDASAIISGEWWRTITALTLHEDPAHLLGNMLFGGLFVGCLRAYWPSGLTWVAVILSGAVGNYLNSFLRREHFFLGASTAVFGALGLLSALRFCRGNKKDLLLSLGAGLALLGMLGTSGKKTDLLAHLFGFGAGFSLGLALEAFKEKILPLETWLKIAAFGIPLLAWGIALYPFNFLAQNSIFNY